MMLVLLLTTSCIPEGDEVASVAGIAPALGKAESADRADRACKVVLRSIGRQPGANGYQTKCKGGVCNYVWKGGVEVAEGLAGKVRVLYRLASDASWWEVEATPAAQGSQPGFALHEFTLAEHLFGPAGPETAIELMPYLALADGGRLFDHNRRPSDFDNYRLDQANGFALGDEGACAPVVGSISFLASWERYTQGNLRQGGYLIIDYAIERLPTCRGTHNGHPAWDIVAHARFLPGGQELSGSVRELESAQGVPTNTAHSKPLTLKIPADATAVEIWFHNFTGAGSSCQAWDSSYGKNYRYDVWPPASHPRCKDTLLWTAVASDVPYRAVPYCVGYDVAKHANADHCELWTSGVGDGHTGHYGIPFGWLEVYLGVGAQQGQLLGAGLWVRYRDKAKNATGERSVLGRDLGGGTWQTGYMYLQTAVMGQGGFEHEIQRLAFFADVRRPSGEVVRLWQSRHGADYAWTDAFSLPTSTKYIPYGKIFYAAEGSSIFDAKRACGK
jgi:hypothetical protein